MAGKFIPRGDVKRETLDWGVLGWICSPGTTGAKDIVVIEAQFAPGGGHNFHKHPDQEEVIYVVQGQVEQWLEDSHLVLGPGDSIFIPADAVHASFTVSAEPARLIAILGPCMDSESGYDVVDVSGEEPWKSLR